MQMTLSAPAPAPQDPPRCSGCGKPGAEPRIVYDRRLRRARRAPVHQLPLVVVQTSSPPAMTARISVVAIRPVSGTGATRAFVDVAIGGVRVLGAKVVQQEGRAAWIAMPSIKSASGHGGIRSSPCRSCSRRRYAKWCSRVVWRGTSRRRRSPCPSSSPWRARSGQARSTASTDR